MPELIEVPPGLAGVAVTATSIGDVEGERGFYHYRGRPAPELATSEDFETVAALVLDGSDGRIDGDRTLPPEVAGRVGELDPRTGLSALAASLGLRPLLEIDPAQRRRDAERLIAAFPTLLASIHRGRPVEPDPERGLVTDYLRMLTGQEPTAEAVAALETYFILTIDHGFNSSTFTTRVVASTGADLGACVVAGLSALSGPRHGGAIEVILDMFDAIGDPADAEEWMKGEMAARRPILGFGHSVYRAADPRGVLLKAIAADLAPERYGLARAAEEAALRVLAGRRLMPNVDFWAGVVLEGCGVPRGRFATTFAAARIVGWCAHAIEQAEETKIIRPAAFYVGPPPG